MSDPAAGNEAQAFTDQARRIWQDTAPGWAKWDAEVGRWMTPATAALFEMAGLAPGQRVLDLASGAGGQTLEAARRVGPEGAVVANDISAAMLGYVAERAQAAGLANVSTLVGAAEDLALPPASFDAAICRLGLMLFAKPGRALSAVREALRPGGRAAAAVVFTTPERNPFMALPREIVTRLAGKPPVPPGAPGVFALGASGVLADLFGEAGYVDYRERTIAIEVRMASTEDAVSLLQEAAGAYRALLADCSEAVKAAAWAEVREVLSQFETAEGFLAPGEVVVGAGTKPG